ncbi:MAG: hypothetical protein Q8916_09610 [Bacteroidota bacterium]|nr:hypothetical protein [Bacteroidota bacterium]MDP4236777.1 hypothetical protein [Bacteroidota bacterium]
MRKTAFFFTYLVVALSIGIFLAVAIPKFLYPYEAHWMEGSMLDQIKRVMGGKPLYCAPSLSYVPWLYEPLYHYSAALFGYFAGLSFPIARIPSVLATIATVSLLYFVVRKETKSVPLSIASIGLYLAAFGKVEYSYVAARLDPLFNFFLVAAFVAVYYSRSNRSLILAALLLALCYFTKQTALVFAPSLILYLWRIRNWKPAVVFTAAFCFFVLGGIFLFDRLYDGWFSYYTLLVPQGKGKTIRWAYAFDGLIFYFILRCWLVTTITAFMAVPVLLVKRSRGTPQPVAYFGLFFLTSLAAGFFGILNYGGGHNVLLPAAASCAIFLPLAAHKYYSDKKFVRFALWAVPLQIIVLISNPWKDPRNVVSTSDRLNQEQFFAYASGLSGEIWIPYHGFTSKYTGKTSYADIVAIRDVLLVGDTSSHRLQHDLDTALANKHWSTIISDVHDTWPNYEVVDRNLNRNKVHVNDDTMLYIFRPQK